MIENEEKRLSNKMSPTAKLKVTFFQYFPRLKIKKEQMCIIDVIKKSDCIDFTLLKKKLLKVSNSTYRHHSEVMDNIQQIADAVQKGL